MNSLQSSIPARHSGPVNSSQAPVVSSSDLQIPHPHHQTLFTASLSMNALSALEQTEAQPEGHHQLLALLTDNCIADRTLLFSSVQGEDIHYAQQVNIPPNGDPAHLAVCTRLNEQRQYDIIKIGLTVVSSGRSEFITLSGCPHTPPPEATSVSDEQTPSALHNAYSSSFVDPVSLERESIQGSRIAPHYPDRQLFSVDVSDSSSESDVSYQEAFVSRREGLPAAMALVTHGDVDKNFSIDPGLLRPVTPRLDQKFKDISNQRVYLMPEDIEEFSEFDAVHRDVLSAPGITYLPKAANVKFENVISFDDGKFFIKPVHRDEDIKIATNGVANCIACMGRAVSRFDPDFIFLGGIHYTGIDSETGECHSPTECLSELSRRFLMAGADMQDFKIFLAGGERISGLNANNMLEDENEFLNARFAGFPIASARIQSVAADTETISGEHETISRYTNDDQASSINAVLTKDNLYYSHSDLF